MYYLTNFLIRDRCEVSLSSKSDTVYALDSISTKRHFLLNVCKFLFSHFMVTWVFFSAGNRNNNFLAYRSIFLLLSSQSWNHSASHCLFSYRTLKYFLVNCWRKLSFWLSAFKTGDRTSFFVRLLLNLCSCWETRILAIVFCYSSTVPLQHSVHFRCLERRLVDVCTRRQGR